MATGCNGDAAAACSQQQQEPFPVEKATKIFECSVCLMIFHHPVSISCGHTFCAECLAQSVAAMQACPMCRRPVPAADRPVNLVVDAAMKLVLPANVLAARAHEAASTAAQRASASSFHVPLFMLGTGFFAAPGTHINLRVFEPRYRLLMSMCLQHGTRFGVPVGSLSRGVLIRVDSVTPSGAGDLHLVGFVDGRYENVGLPAVMPDSHGLVGVQAKRVEDSPGGDEEACRVLANTARAAVAARSAALSREEAAWQARTLGPPPSSPAQLSFWLLVALEPPQRDALLFDTSAKARLTALVEWMGQGGAE